MKRAVIFLLALTGIGSIAKGQSTNAYIRPLGTKTLYISGADTEASPPKGYAPFFINYVGRHGARHATGTAELARLDQFLRQAGEAHALRSDGLCLQKMVSLIYKIEQNYPSGTLTAVGEAEQFSIGKDMGDRYPDVVRQPDNCLQIMSTPEVRTVQSAESFLKGLASSSTCITRTPDDSIRLRFFSLSPVYKSFEKKGEWRAVQSRLEEADAYRQMGSTLLDRLFDSTWSRQLEEGANTAFATTNNFLMAIYSAAVTAPGLREELIKAGHQPEEADIFSLLSSSEAGYLAYIDGAKDYFVKGPGLDAGGIQVRVAAPLLADFIESSNRWLQSGKRGADLRFAHAETLAPFAALMGCEGCAASTSDPAHYSEAWKSDQIIGYSANIQWVFYRRDKNPDDCLLKVLYNERPIHLPIATNQYPYYSWKAVKAYYLSRLHLLNADPGRDMYTYLRELK